MHELSVTQNLLNLALTHADGKRVTDLYIVIGQLSSFVDESVQMYWDIISEGTLADHSRLHFSRILAQMECGNCQYRYLLTADQFACPECGSEKVSLISGDEFYLDSIEVLPMEQIVT